MNRLAILITLACVGCRAQAAGPELQPTPEPGIEVTEAPGVLESLLFEADPSEFETCCANGGGEVDWNEGLVSCAGPSSKLSIQMRDGVNISAGVTVHSKYTEALNHAFRASIGRAPDEVDADGAYWELTQTVVTIAKQPNGGTITATLTLKGSQSPLGAQRLQPDEPHERAPGESFYDWIVRNQ
jgi:hypothetical protein